jgi:hypothetical protein
VGATEADVDVATVDALVDSVMTPVAELDTDDGTGTPPADVTDGAPVDATGVVFPVSRLQ